MGGPCIPQVFIYTIFFINFLVLLNSLCEWLDEAGPYWISCRKAYLRTVIQY